MKSVNKSVIAVAVLAVLFSGSINSVNAAEAMIQSTDGSNVFLSIHGQDESIKSYDLDQIDNNTAAITTNTKTINTLQGATVDNSHKITALRGDLTAEANERLSNDTAQNQNISDNKTAIDSVNADLQANKNLLSLKADVAQQTANDADKKADQALQQSAKNGSDIVDIKKQASTFVTAPEMYQMKQDQKIVDANQDGNLLNHETRINALEVAHTPTNGVNGTDGKDGKDGKDGVSVKGDKGDTGAAGKDGKDGVTTTLTKKEVDTATINKVKSLESVTDAQTKDLKAAQQVFAQTQANTNSQFKSLKDEVESNKKEARAGVASAVAIASMPQVEKDQSVMFSAGVGSFKDEQAVSVGASFHVGSHAIVKAGVSDSTNNDFAMGAGVGIGF